MGHPDIGTSALSKGRGAQPPPLADRIVAALPQLSKKHTEIAQFILDHQDIVAFASANEVGIRTHSSAATVVRFCQALGFGGYPELQDTIRERVVSQWTDAPRLERRLSGPGPSEDLLTRVFGKDIRNIERTAELGDTHQLKSAAAEIRRARQTLIVGTGLAAALADSLAYSLQSIDLPAQSVTGGEEPMALALAFLRSQDVMVGISFRADPKNVVQAIEKARSVGAKSIGIARSQLSPVVQIADYAFTAVIDGMGHSFSLSAAVSLLNGLIAAISAITRDQPAVPSAAVDTAIGPVGSPAE
jgi:DNA-binding MurR/RpiR family transcriptional regulator